jgi:hypothetical protein
VEIGFAMLLMAPHLLRMAEALTAYYWAYLCRLLGEAPKQATATSKGIFS